jgi:hypothetical protein
MNSNPPLLILSATLALAAMPWQVLAENEYENAPISYSDTAPNDAAQALEKRMLTGKVKIDRQDAWSVLHGVMKEFHIPAESQVMVFSKTSKQNDRITPQTPRVVYFGDDAYIGYCLGGAIEVSTIDPVLGPIFYLLDPYVEESKPLHFERDQSCLSCHGGPFSPDVPGCPSTLRFPWPRGPPDHESGQHRGRYDDPIQGPLGRLVRYRTSWHLPTSRQRHRHSKRGTVATSTLMQVPISPTSAEFFDTERLPPETERHRRL